MGPRDVHGICMHAFFSRSKASNWASNPALYSGAWCAARHTFVASSICTLVWSFDARVPVGKTHNPYTENAVVLDSRLIPAHLALDGDLELT